MQRTLIVLTSPLWLLPICCPVLAASHRIALPPVKLISQQSNQPNQLRRTEARDLFKQGIQQFEANQFQDALQTWQKVLGMRRELGDRDGEADTLLKLGAVYEVLGQYSEALKSYQTAADIFATLKNEKENQVGALSGVGIVHLRIGAYSQAIAAFQKALAIMPNAATSLNGIGLAYTYLGQYERALTFHQKALAVRRQIGYRAGEATSLLNIGGIYESLEQYPKALDHYQRALKIYQEINNLTGQERSLNSIGTLQNQLGKHAEAMPFFAQALKIAQEIGDLRGLGITTHNLGKTHFHLGQFSQALDFYQQAIRIRREIGDREGEGATLNNIGELLSKRNQPELAIVFLKQSVDVYETIRQDLRKLPSEQQESYTKTVASTYRSLANLLLQQDRVLEAQQVLDLLKLQELDDYLRNMRGGGKRLDYHRSEVEILEKFNTLQKTATQLGQELAQLRKVPVGDRTAQQQQRIAQLVQLESDLSRQFNQFVASPDIVQLIEQLSRTARRQNINLEDLNALRDNLRQHKAALLYPLILDDRLELILTTPNAPPLRRTVMVKRTDLNRLVSEFRQAMTDTSVNPQKIAQQLYQYLIQPIETDLQQAKTETIIYAPDGALRYIPLAALFNGKQWLVQKYQINYITARSLTDFNSPTATNPRVLAGAFAQGVYQFQLGQRQFHFSGLPYAGKEVEALVATLPGTKLVDREFSRDVTLPKMNDYNIIHFATHAAFVSGQPEDSFILFGDGKIATLRDIENWSLPNVDLVVLSACETGVGGLGNGEEILGLGYQFQRAGARAAIASLWSVRDDSTQIFMNTFYNALKQPGMTKNKALQQAQIALITENVSGSGDQRGIGVVSTTSPSRSARPSFNHPLYWAPFILIGNGL